MVKIETILVEPKNGNIIGPLREAIFYLTHSEIVNVIIIFNNNSINQDIALCIVQIIKILHSTGKVLDIKKSETATF